MKQGWTYLRLGDIASIKSGKSISAKEILADSLFPCYGGNGIRGYVENYNYDGEFPIIGRVGALCGNVHLAKGKFYATEHALVVELNNQNVDPQWLSYQLIALNLRNIAKGAAQPVIAASEVAKRSIHIPPIFEQERIVERLDAAFAQIDELKSNAERQLAEARALFQSALTQAMQPKPGWQEKTLKELSLIAGDYGLSVPSKPYDGVRYLRITDITEWGELNNEFVSADISADDNSKEKLEEGDILFARTGATVGKTLVYKKSFGECLFAGYLIRYRLNKKEIMPQFMHYITHSKEYYDWVQSNQKAAAQPNINAKKYNSYIVRYPKLSEQESIVAQLDALFARVYELEEINRKTAAECDALKQALLRQIFE